MAERGYLLTESDVLVLKELIADFKRTKKPQKSSYRESESDLLPPEVYTAWVPGEGIPAISAEIGTETGTGTGTGAGYNDTVSSAVCDIYRKDSNDILRYTGLTRPVYNLSATAVPGNRWILASRDKWGTWYDAGMVGDSSGSGSGSLTVSEQGGVVNVTDVDRILFRGDQGFVVTDLGGGDALIGLARRGIDVNAQLGVTKLTINGLTGIVASTVSATEAALNGVEAQTTTWGMVTPNAQTWRGTKLFENHPRIDYNNLGDHSGQVFFGPTSVTRSYVGVAPGYGGSFSTPTIHLATGEDVGGTIGIFEIVPNAALGDEVHFRFTAFGSSFTYPPKLLVSTASGVYATGVTGTGGGGDVINGGVVTGLGSGPSLIDGGTW